MANKEVADWSKIPLGQKSDPDIALEYGLNVSSVGSARRRAGIVAFGGRTGGPKKIQWDDQPLGQVRDSELAKRLGVNGSVVHRARTRRGIPKYKTPKTTK